MQPFDIERLKRITDNIMEVRDQQDILKNDEKEHFAEAKEAGFNCAALRKAIAKKRADKSPKAAEGEELAALYYEAIDGGLFAKAAGERLAAMAEEDGTTARVETPEGNVVELGGVA